LKTEVAENKEALATATAIREKELEEFQKEEKDLLESIAALKAAIAVLSKHHGGETEFLQLPRTHVLGVAVTLQHELRQHAGLLKGVLTHAQRQVVESFIQSPEDYFDATPTFKQSYAPQSGEIFGILKQMKETFETNLADAQKEETASQKAYEELKAAKEAEIAAAEEQIEQKTQELATVDEELEQKKEDLEDTSASLAADQEYLAKLKEKCAMTDKEWEERQKTRQLEMEAVSKAIAILSTDDAQDLFSKTFDTAFVQTEVAMHSKRRNQASKLLYTVASKLHSPRLATLALRVRLDAFTKVKKAIDDMIAQLIKEKEDEIKHKDFCTDELNTNQLQTEKKTREKTDLLAKIDELEAKIKALADAIAVLKSEISDLQVQLKRAGEDRETQNKAFQMTVADQRASQKLLQAALNVLKGFYDAKKAALIQKQEPVGPPPPPGFEAYKKNEAAPGVMGEIQIIINDAKAMEAEAIKDEEDAQKAYEVFVMETKSSIDAKAAEIVNKEEEKAKTEQELEITKAELESVENELEQLANYNAELHTACDFTLKNFDIRQTARDEEIEALKQAKAILSGSNFEEFLQHA